jgi:hypothetical protein
MELMLTTAARDVPSGNEALAADACFNNGINACKTTFTVS